MLNLEPSEPQVIQIGVAQPCIGTLWCVQSITGDVAISWLSSFTLCPFCELESMYMETVTGRREVVL